MINIQVYVKSLPRKETILKINNLAGFIRVSLCTCCFSCQVVQMSLYMYNVVVPYRKHDANSRNVLHTGMSYH